MLTTPLPPNAERLQVSYDHIGNFFECVRSRKDPICDVETGHRSGSECHLAQIALRLRRKLKWDAGRIRGSGSFYSATCCKAICSVFQRPFGGVRLLQLIRVAMLLASLYMTTVIGRTEFCESPAQSAAKKGWTTRCQYQELTRLTNVNQMTRL